MKAITTKFICSVCGRPTEFQKGFSGKTYEVIFTVPCVCKGLPPEPASAKDNVRYMADYGFKPAVATLH